MTVEELVEMTNDMIQFCKSDDGILIRSRAFKYADFIPQDAIGAIEMVSESKIRISVPKGTKMGDKEIVADMETGVVTADGNVFDEPMPDYARSPKTMKKADVRFTPSINGFSIGSVKTMPSEDGYACYCKVYFKGKKIGDFVDKGDGSEYSFYADKPYCSGKVENVVRSFPLIVRDYGMGSMEVEYCIGIMVDDLMEMKEIAKQIKKLGPMGKDYVRIDGWKKGLQLSASIPSSMGDEEMSEGMRKNLSVRGMAEYEIRRYRSLDELHLVNTFVTGEMLR